MGNKRGSVTRAFSRNKRYYNDEDYREKIKACRKDYYGKNKDKVLKHIKKYSEKLDEFANKRCKKCKKLIPHKNKTLLCKKHRVEFEVVK